MGKCKPITETSKNKIMKNNYSVLFIFNNKKAYNYTSIGSYLSFNNTYFPI